MAKLMATEGKGAIPLIHSHYQNVSGLVVVCWRNPYAPSAIVDSLREEQNTAWRSQVMDIPRDLGYHGYG